MEQDLISGIFIGLVQVAEGYLLIRANGTINLYSSITSIIEFGWFIATIYYLLNYDFNTLGLAIASAYLSYNIMGWIKSRQLLKGMETSDDIINLTIPRSFALTTIFFGSAYSTASFLALQVIWLKESS